MDVNNSRTPFFKGITRTILVPSSDLTNKISITQKTEIVDLFSSYILKETETTARRGASKISENTLHRGGGEEGGVHFYSNVINDWYRGVANKNKAHRA